MVLNYKVLLRKENEGGYTVTAQPYRLCYIWCNDEESLLMVKAIEGYIESLRHGEDIPSDDGVRI